MRVSFTAAGKHVRNDLRYPLALFFPILKRAVQQSYASFFIVSVHITISFMRVSFTAAGKHVRNDLRYPLALLFPILERAVQQLHASFFTISVHITISFIRAIKGRISSDFVFKLTLLATSRAVIPA